MRSLEISLLSILTLYALSVFVKAEKKNRWFRLLPGFSLFLLPMRILVEGHRWQMLPVYLYAALLFAFTLKNINVVQRPSDKSRIQDRMWLRMVKGGLNILLLIVTTMTPLLVPVFRLPIPTGPYSVGIRNDYFIDKSHPEPLTPDLKDFQEISVQVRYPAEISRADNRVEYWENASTKSKIVSTFWGGLPQFLSNHFSLTKTHSYLDASLSTSEQTFPVLIFNHGSMGLPSLNTVLIEELARNGYIVFSIGHSDYIPFFVRHDGSIKAFDPNSEALRSKMRENNDHEVRNIAHQLMQSEDLNEQPRLVREFLETNPESERSLFRCVEDISFTIKVV